MVAKAQDGKTPPEAPKTEATVEAPKVRFYWSKASRCSLGGFRPEDRDKMQYEQSLRFIENMFSVSEDEVWKHCPKDRDSRPVDENRCKVYQFIETHNVFKNGQVRRVKSAAEGQALTMAQNRMKQFKDIESEDVTLVSGGTSK